MNRCVFFLLSMILASPWASGSALLLVSIDGLRPDYVLQADAHGLKIPHLRRILRDGAHATGARGVLPTVTYPSHTTIVTGVWPAKHGIYTNTTFDPLGLNFEGWYWYSEDIAVPTLWEAAAKAGMIVGSVSWPVSVGALGIRYNVPEYWRAPQGADDLKVMRAVSTPGLVAEIAKDAGPYNNDIDDAIPGDLARTRYAVWILRHGKPQFMTVHLAALDHIEQYGSHHTDAILTQDAAAAARFLAEVDSANVLHNCSTRFSDGFRYGFGAEVGISTSKLHARGPVGLDGIVTYKYRLIGSGHIVRDYTGTNALPFRHQKLKL